MDITIIGAGIGGLSTALALKRANIPFKVYESAAELKAVGAGIIIANNAMQVYRHLGIHHQIMEPGNRISAITLTKADFKTLSNQSLEPFEKHYGLSNIAIHRADLHQVLIREVGLENIVLNKRLLNIEKLTQGYTLQFEDGTRVDTDYVIGADGIKSKVRQELFAESQLRNSGQICWRGLTEFDLPAEYQHSITEALGKGKRFGFLKINRTQVYWYLLANEGAGDEHSDLSQQVKDFHPLAGQLLKATPKEQILFAPLYDLKPIHVWNTETACLIGDAAHATTPNLGQGACQAIEDAYVLGELLKKYSIEEAFKKYPLIRKAKAHGIVRTSWTFGKIAQASNPIIIAIRNFLFKSMPPSVNQKQLAQIFSLDNV